MKAKLAADPQLIDLEDSAAPRRGSSTTSRSSIGKPRGGYGVDVLAVGQAIPVHDRRGAGRVLPARRRAGDELDIRLRFPSDARTVAAFDQLKITTP